MMRVYLTKMPGELKLRSSVAEFLRRSYNADLSAGAKIAIVYFAR